MRSLVPKLLTVAVALAAAFVWVPAAGAAPTFSGAFKLPAGGKLSTNNKIVAGPDGNVWFTVETPGKEVAKITPAGVITEYALPEAAGATGIAVGPEGKIWLTAVEKAISFSPVDPEKTEAHFKVESIGAEGQISQGLFGEMWVASNNEVTHFSPADPEVKSGSFKVNELTPKDIDWTGSGMVIADAGHGRLVTIGSGGNQGPDIPLGNGTTTSQGVAGNLNGQAAFSKSDGTEGLGLVAPPPTPTAVLMPGDPFGVALGTDGNYWFAMSAAHGVEQLTPTGQATALAFVGFEKWFPRQITAGPGGTLWVTMEVPGTEEFAIALITGVTAPVVNPPPPVNPIVVTQRPVPNTRFGKGPKKVVKTTGAKATVKFTFSSTVAGSTFQCKLTTAPSGRGKKAKGSKGAFRGCQSPRVLKLVPGKYRFAVRALAVGAVDGSPAERAFKVIRSSRHR